ncbi:MAG: hypothetical protein HC845_06790 [Akkermansiaceae bacterium]|nr:hypothetical protein [Akkermansiaceae bacterium]
MTQVTVRNIDDEWVTKAKVEAAARKVSMNFVLREAIGRGLGVKPAGKTNGLEKFTASMPFESEEERKQWDAHMTDCGRVDPLDWQ